MTHFLKLALISTAVYLLTGCSDPTIDASSDEAFYQSTQKIRDSLDGEQKDAFSDALAVVTLGGIDIRAVFAGQAENELSRSIKSLDGMNAEQVIAEAEEVQRKRDAQAAEKRQARKEEIRAQIQALETKQR